MNVLFDTQLHNIWTNKSVPLMTWELFECNYKKQPRITKLINNHTFDTYIHQFGDRLKTWLAGNDDDRHNDYHNQHLAHEMNGNWYPWSWESSPDDYILAWHHIHDIISNKSIGSTRVQWIWCVNSADVTVHKAEQYYVDWLGIDGYNWVGTRNWKYGTTSVRPGNISDIELKSEWLNLFYEYLDNNQIKMASYFNTEKETDWAIFGGIHGDVTWNNLNAYSAYRNDLQTNNWIQPNITNLRLITDDQFAGKS